MKPVIRAIWQIILIVIGWLTVLVGLLIIPLPIPLGLLLIIVGLSILTFQSQYLRGRIRQLRRRYGHFSMNVKRLTPRLPKLLRQAVEMTEPDKKD